MKRSVLAKTATSDVRSLVCALAMACLSSGCSSPIGSGDGKVIDFVSKETIPQATVTLTCTVPKLVHGSDKIVLKTESAADGSYRFDPAGLRGCDFFFARALKPGYGLDHMTNALTNPGPDTSRQIPNIVYLIKERDQPMVLLERLAERVPLGSAKVGPFAPAEFSSVYMLFISSKRIATSPALADWVREKYCARLQAGWDVLTEEQRAGLRYDDSSSIDWSPISLRSDSYKEEVQPSCGV